MRKRNFIIYVMSVLALVAIVGSGFALFFFGERSKNKDQGKIDMSVESSPDLGILTIAKPEDVNYAIFFTSNSIYLYRSDNITQSAQFALDVAVSSQADVQEGYKIALQCYIEVSDSDDRGIRYDSGRYSESIVDYLAPSALKFSEKSIPFSGYDPSDTAKSQIYVCTIEDDVINALKNSQSESVLSENDLKGTYNFSIELMYKNKDLSENATKYITEAKENSKIKILFELALVESN